MLLPDEMLPMRCNAVYIQSDTKALGALHRQTSETWKTKYTISSIVGAFGSQKDVEMRTVNGAATGF